MINLTVNVNMTFILTFISLFFFLCQTHLKKWLEVAAISQKSGQNKSNGQVIGQVSAERSTSQVFFLFFFLSFFPSFFSFHEYAWLIQMTTIFDWRDLNVSRLSNRLRSKKQVLSPPLSVNCQSTVSLSCQTFVLYWLHDKGLIVLDLSNCGSLYWSKKPVHVVNVFL